MKLQKNGAGTKSEESAVTPGATGAQDTHLEVVVGKDESDVGQMVCEGQLTRKSTGEGSSKGTGDTKGVLGGEWSVVQSKRGSPGRNKIPQNQLQLV